MMRSIRTPPGKAPDVLDVPLSSLASSTASAARYDEPPTLASAASSGLLFVRRNLARIALVTVFLASAIFGALYFLFNQYSATALIMVDPRSAKIAQNSIATATGAPDVNAIDSLVLIAKSEAFLGAVLDKLTLMQEPYFAESGVTAPVARANAIEKLRSRLSVARRGTTYLIEASASTPFAAMSARIANAVAQKIIDDQSDLRSGTSEKTAQNIDGRLADLRGRVARAEDATAQYRAKLKVTDAGQGSTLLERRVYELNQQTVLAGSRTGEARARYEQLRKAQASAGDNLSPSIQSGVLNTLRAEYARLSRQSADQGTVLGAHHPEVGSVRAQLADVKRQIGAEVGRLMTTARTEFLEAQQREALIARQLKDTQGESNELGGQLVRLTELERDAKAERAVYEQLLARERDLTETKNVEPNEIRLISPAVAPTRTTLGKSILAAIAALLGGLGGLAYAMAREAMRPTLRTARQAERLTGVEIAGFAPLLVRDSVASGSFDLAPWLGDACASFASNESDKSNPSRSYIILVTSARRGEGRSTVAASMAKFYAGSGARVLLIEADRARPSRGKEVFGLMDVLETSANLQGALVRSPSNAYTLLPFGGRVASAKASTSAVMSNMALRATLNVCRRWFDIVIIDGPPALEASHARLLAKQADVVAFVAEWDKTSSTDVGDALECLDVDEAALVFNKVDVARFRLFEPERSQRIERQSGEMALAA